MREVINWFFNVKWWSMSDTIVFMWLGVAMLELTKVHGYFLGAFIATLVSLLTTNLSTGEEKLTEGFEREVLEKWILHSKNECADGILEWEIKEKV